jgi:nitroimidazol reductase NimA-like FMN-containing flavoprotein (pyridoxamine 5'-phosphate oxidase superfamily)
MDRNKLRQRIFNLLDSQKLAILSTSENGRPYASLVAFGYSSDSDILFFATTRSTRKYANIMNQPRIAFLIDNRSNREDDFHQAAAVTALGDSEELFGEEKAQKISIYLKRHPFLKEFAGAPTTAFFAVRVEKYIYVSRFQEVFEYQLKDGHDLADP